MVKKEKMQVYLRVRPLLRQIEDQSVWHVDREHNMIESTCGVAEIMNTNLKKRYQDTQENMKFYYDRIYDHSC